LERAKARLLERLLGHVQIVEVAQESAERLGTRADERGIDPGDLAHRAVKPPGRKTRKGRISYEPFDELALPSSRAVSIACSRSAHSTMKKPRSCSLVSANGPSMIIDSRPLRTVVAEVVGMRRATGPSRPSFASFSWTTPSLAIAASSCSLVQPPTAASLS